MTAAVIAALVTLTVGVVIGLIVFRPRSPAPGAPRSVTVAAPGPAPQRAPTTRRCDYCMSEISSKATRCPSCAGEFRYCPTDRRLVGTTSNQKFVGLARGGMKTQYRCMSCNRVLDGPRF